jgi:hypothetical protein
METIVSLSYKKIADFLMATQKHITDHHPHNLNYTQTLSSSYFLLLLNTLFPFASQTLNLFTSTPPRHLSLARLEDLFLFVSILFPNNKRSKKIVLLSSIVSVGDETSSDQSINQCFSNETG